MGERHIEVTIGSIQVQLIAQNAGIFVGNNLPVNWCLQMKSNSAGGTVAGDGNILYQTINVINDPDVIDANWIEIDQEEKKNGDEPEKSNQTKKFQDVLDEVTFSD